MRMDTLVESDNCTWIIDTKYYKNYTQQSYYGEKLISGNIYQMLSYLNNINVRTNELMGVLLYPKPYDAGDIDKTYNLSVTSNGEIKQAQLRFLSIDLSKDWRTIKKDLLALIR